MIHLKDEVKRECLGKGICLWCGAGPKNLYDYLAPGALDYKLNRFGPQGFCGLDCFVSYNY